MDLASLAAAQQAWQTPTYTAGWIDFDAGTSTLFGGVRYMKDSLGFVHFKGLAKNTTGSSKGMGSVIVTVPAGYRPGNMLRFDTNGNDVHFEIDVKNDGTVIVTGTSSCPNGGWVQFNGISYLAEA